MSVISSRSSSPVRRRSISDSDDERVVPTRSPEAESEPGLFVSPTIARDEAQGESSRRQELLTSFNSRVINGPPLQQRNGGPGPPPPGTIGRGPPPPPPFNPFVPRRADSDLERYGHRPRIKVRSRRRPSRSPSLSDPGSYPRAKISTKSGWRRKAARKTSGATEDLSGDEGRARSRKQREENGSRDASKQSRASSGKNGHNDAQPSMDGLAGEPVQPEKASDQTNGDDKLPKEEGSKLSNTMSSPESDSGHSGSSRTTLSRVSEKETSETEEATMAEALNAVAEKYLRLNVAEQKDDISKFIGYLLDTIERLQAMTRYNRATDDDASSSSGSGTETEDDDKPVIPRGQILHRVFCQNDDHDHDRTLFEDDPVYKGKNRMLTGQVSVPNLDFFVRRHPDVCYIVMKEHICAGNERQRSRRGYFGDTRDSVSERSESIHIESPKLQKALFQVAEFHPFPTVKHSGSSRPFRMDAPYHFLFHHRQKLESLSHNTSYEDVLRPLLEWLKENYEKEYDEAERLFADGFVTARHMSKLFKPNQMVVHRGDHGNLSAYVLSESVLNKKEKLSFHGWSWQYDGHRLQRRTWSESMNMISEEQVLISRLMIHPLNYATEKDKAALEKVGKKYWAMREQTYTCYTGWDVNQEHHYKNARFMVDTATYHLMHPMAKALDKAFPDAVMPAMNGVHSVDHARFDTRPNRINKDEDISPEDIMLLPAIVLGFNFQAKKWTRLAVANTHEVDWNKKAFDRLVLDQKMKDMIYALVDVQISAGKMEDIITGKGNGLIILLHGSPGTGKTLTAESVAEISEKPLYRVTCGDIGTEAEEVERYLETVMYLGKIWNCVLLLDEADVFLEERTMADLQRNSLVSVFLRTLEYYEGILILTSNRVGTFDEAFKSRIQVAIHYNNLTKTSRKAIWQNFLDMIEESPDEDANLPELERRLDELARQDMNGRQIRNALLTARQLAKHRQERLDWSHLSQVIKTSAEFHKYLVTVKGHSDDQWAREEGVR